jgi:hypothetical protein
MKMYCFVMNGAAINCHTRATDEEAKESALRQARQWKQSHPFKTIKIEEHVWDSKKRSYVRSYNDIDVELPMCAPHLTPRWDWDTEYPTAP